MKRYLKSIIIGSCLLLLFSVSLLAADQYVSSKYSVHYHKPSCKKALKIDPLIKVIYNSPKEALEAGKRPCQMCKPPTAEVNLEEKKPQEN
jgi:methylphosphotriester-DNA--protein-cysteine methyltransferase